MKTIWVVDDGEYSDYHVIGVFTTKGMARDVARAFKLGDDSIHEWPLNPGVAELNKGLWQYTVVMLRDGSTERITRKDELYDLELSSYLWDRPNAPAYAGRNIPAALVATVWARDDKHAVKIANERRTQMIANGEWK